MHHYLHAKVSFNMKDKNSILLGYLQAALWASNDDNGDPLEDNYTTDDFSPDAITWIKSEIDIFLEQAGELVSDLEEPIIGHDIFLTRNGHESGFSDRGLGATGDRLAEIASSLGDSLVYEVSGQLEVE
jgi:hypothetical protein